MPENSNEPPPTSSDRLSLPLPYTSFSSCHGRLMTRSSPAVHTPPSHAAPSPMTRSGFSVEKLYEFEAPQFYDFTKKSDPERVQMDEHWFDFRKRTPSSPDNFHFVGRSSLSVAGRPRSATGKIDNKGNFSGSNSGWSFLNTPIGKGKSFMLLSSVADCVRSSGSFHPKAAALKKSATTENVMNFHHLMGSDYVHEPPSTIVRSTQKRFRDIGSDEKKIISGFLNTPLLVVRTPKNGPRSNLFKKELPRSPLQKVTMKLNSGFICEIDPHESSLFVKETSSLEEMSSPFHKNDDEVVEVEATFTRNPPNTGSSSLVDTFNKETTPPSSLSLQSKDTHSSSLSSSFTFNTSRHASNTFTVKSTAAVSTNIQEYAPDFVQKSLQSPPQKEFLAKLSTSASTSSTAHDSFQAILKARARAEQERIEALSVQNARKIQRLKAGPSTLPIKSIKPLTVPEEFVFGYDNRAQLKKMNQKQPHSQHQTKYNVKLPKSSAYQKPAPTVPKSPMFASKIRPSSQTQSQSQLKGSENSLAPNGQNVSELRKKFEYRPNLMTSQNQLNIDKVGNGKIPLTIPKSPKLSSIYRNRNK